MKSPAAASGPYVAPLTIDRFSPSSAFDCPEASMSAPSSEDLFLPCRLSATGGDGEPTFVKSQFFVPIF